LVNAIVDKLKSTIRETLGDLPSDLFLNRVDRRLDEAEKNGISLDGVCDRITNMVNLFIGTEESRALDEKFKELLSREV